MNNAGEALDTEDLETLFDTIAASVTGAGGAQPECAESRIATHESEDTRSAENVISSIGRMTRGLHDSLRELGFDKLLEKAAESIPDARDRLAYVAAMTEQAAQRALDATDAARPIQEQLEAGATGLSSQWGKLFDGKLGVAEFRDLVQRTRAYLDEVPQHTRRTNEQLREIMMAQDFQDLTGQVIKKITELAQTLEQQLVQLLLDNAPPRKREEAAAGLLNGPAIRPEGRGDVVTSQRQVDDLLESLGF